MPMLFPNLSSSDDISLCGPIRYELLDPESSETVSLQSSSGSVTYSLNSAVDEFVKFVRVAPDDNSSPIKLEIEAEIEDYTAECASQLCTHLYQFGVRASFDDWPGFTMDYKDISDGQNELKFAVKVVDQTPIIE